MIVSLELTNTPIPVGRRVRIKVGGFGARKLLGGREATVIGYDENPPRSITMLRLQCDGDPMFKWPKLFPWEVEVLE